MTFIYQATCNGCSASTVAVRGAAYFGQGSSSSEILIDDLGCTGQESSILECAQTVGPDNCGHSEDVGVICPTSKWLPFVNTRIPQYNITTDA